MGAPKPGLADLSENDRRELEAWLVDFDRQWGDGALPEQARRLPHGSSWRLPALCEMVKIDLERQWAHGNRLSLEAYLREYPELGNPDDVSADLIQAEYQVRKQFGVVADLDDYARRFPAQVDELRRLIAGQQTASWSARPADRAPLNPFQPGAPAGEPLLPSPESFGRYRLIKRLGKGGMGSVYLARDTELEREVALKISDLGGSAEAMKQFQREARALAALDHPSICPVYDYGVNDGVPFLTMAYLKGTSMARALPEEGIEPRQAGLIVRKLALAMQEAHARGVIHRDLKPSNIMMKPGGQEIEPVIVDFGLARRDDSGESSLTATGQGLGTFAYMSIEQIHGDFNALGPSCDVYALGVILYELLTGRRPFEGTAASIVIQKLEHRFRPPGALRPDLDSRLEAICLKAMAKEAKDRYASMAELATALSAYSGAPEGATRAAGAMLESEPEAGRSRPPRPIRLAVAAAFAMIVLGVVIYAVTDKGRIKITVEGPKVAVKIDGDEVRVEGLDEPITLRAGKHVLTIKRGSTETETRKFVVRRGPNESLRIEYAPRRMETDTAGKTTNVAEANPWPQALALTGKQLPVRGRFLAMSRDCRRIAVAAVPADPDKTWTDLRIVEAPGTGPVVAIQGISEYIWRAEFSPDGKQLAVSTNDGLVRLCDTASGKEVHRFSGVHLIIAFSPDGKRLAAGAAGGSTRSLYVWDLATAELVATLSGGPSNWIWCLAFSPDGKRLAGGSGLGNGQKEGEAPTAGEIQLWELETGTCTKLEGHSNRVSGIAFSPDGKRLASASYDATVKVWDLATKECLITFDKHRERVVSVAFTPSGRLITSAGTDSPVRLCWDAETGREVASLSGVPINPYREDGLIHFSPDGHLMYSGAESTLKAWEVPTAGPSRDPELNSSRAGSLGEKRPLAPFVREGIQAVGSPNPPMNPELFVNSVGMKMKRLPPGEFLMGSSYENPPHPSGNPIYNPNNKPQHRVRITQSFYLGVYEVTQEQYEKVAGINPSGFRGKLDLPVETVSWFDAVAFCNQLSEGENLAPYYKSENGTVTVRGGEGYRLPTEAEWEYACRAGTTTPYRFGEESNLTRYAWSRATSERLTHPVGQKLPNAFGLYDMNGNVGEWCWDWYDENYYAGSPTEDPAGPSAGTEKLARGGSYDWISPGVFTPDLRSRHVVLRQPSVAERANGFRVARTARAVRSTTRTGEGTPQPSVPPRDIDAPKEGFQPLFNGKDLTGWKTYPKQPGIRHVADGVLVGSGPAIGHLDTERDDFTDFGERAFFP